MTFDEALNKARRDREDVGPEVAWSEPRRSNAHKVRITRHLIFQLSKEPRFVKARPWFLEIAEDGFNAYIHRTPRSRQRPEQIPATVWAASLEFCIRTLHEVSSASQLAATEILKRENKWPEHQESIPAQRLGL